MSDADKPVFDLAAGGVRYCQEPELRARISTLEARIEELTREREASERGWRERCDQLAQHRDALQKRLGVGFLGDDGRDAASFAAAARAERDEAVGLLRRWLANGQCETVPLEERWKRKQEIVCGRCTTCQVLAYLARLAAAPEDCRGLADVEFHDVAIFSNGFRTETYIDGIKIEPERRQGSLYNPVISRREDTSPLTPPITASGGSAATGVERDPQPPAQQPESRLPDDDDS